MVAVGMGKPGFRNSLMENMIRHESEVMKCWKMTHSLGISPSRMGLTFDFLLKDGMMIQIYSSSCGVKTRAPGASCPDIP